MLKKTMPLLAALTIVTACSNDEAAKNNSEASNNTQEPLQAEEQQVILQENEQLTEYAQSPSPENADTSEWASLPEYNTIMEQIDGKDYTFETVTDNEEKRILYMLDGNGRKQYKTVFVKHTNRLKIIQINGGGQIFNEILSS